MWVINEQIIERDLKEHVFDMLTTVCEQTQKESFMESYKELVQNLSDNPKSENFANYLSTNYSGVVEVNSHISVCFENISLSNMCVQLKYNTI